MPTEIEEDIFSKDAWDWFQKLDEGGGDLPPISQNESDDENKQYVDVVPLSLAFYRIVKTVAEQGLLDWVKIWGILGGSQCKKISNRLRELPPSKQFEVYKDYINYKSFAYLILRKEIASDDCFFLQKENPNQYRMVVDAHQIADDLIDNLEGYFQRGALDVIRRMSMEEQINTGINPSTIISETTMKALGYKALSYYDKSAHLLNKIFRSDIGPQINQIGKPNLNNFGIQLADKPRRDLAL